MSFRAQIKEYAKARMHTQYGNLFLSYILTSFSSIFAIGLFIFFFSFVLAFLGVMGGMLFTREELLLYYLLFLAGIPLFIGLLLVSPFTEVGFNGTALMVARNKKITATEPFTIGFKNYLRKVGGIAWMTLFTFLWSLLFLIPGIVKAYSYRFTPYILADCPNVSARAALEISMRMTYGIKWELFVFDLSFVGWHLLNGLTSGILGIYTTPYYKTAFAALYDSMKNNAIENGRISAEELL